MPPLKLNLKSVKIRKAKGAKKQDKEAIKLKKAKKESEIEQRKFARFTATAERKRKEEAIKKCRMLCNTAIKRIRDPESATFNPEGDHFQKEPYGKGMSR